MSTEGFLYNLESARHLVQSAPHLQSRFAANRLLGMAEEKARCEALIPGVRELIKKQLGIDVPESVKPTLQRYQCLKRHQAEWAIDRGLVRRGDLHLFEWVFHHRRVLQQPLLPLAKGFNHPLFTTEMITHRITVFVIMNDAGEVTKMECRLEDQSRNRGRGVLGSGPQTGG